MPDVWPIVAHKIALDGRIPDEHDRFAVHLVTELHRSGYMTLTPRDEMLAHASYVIAEMLRRKDE